MTPVTPAEWLPVLTERLDAGQPRIDLLRRYVDGDAPLPEMGKNVRASWQRFQRQSRANLAVKISSSVADRLIPNGIDVGANTDEDAVVAAQRIWRDNRMKGVVVPQAIRHMLNYRTSYLAAWAGADGHAVITAESPEMMYAATDPLQPWKVRAAVKWWRDSDTETDFALVWCPIGWQLFKRSVWINPYEVVSKRIRNNRASSGQWEPASGFAVTGETPPVVVLENPLGYGEFEQHLDGIARVNAGILERRVTSAMQAWRQRALKGGLPPKDPDGNDIDWAAVFEPAPGALWDLPNGIDLWESEATDIRPLLEGVKDDLRELSEMTSTPFAALLPGSQNQSATGSASMKEALILKSRNRLDAVDTAVSAIMSRALRVEGVETDETIAISWEPPEHVSLSEKYDAASKAKGAGESWKSIARNILGYSPEQIAQDALDRAEEQLSSFTIGGDTNAVA